MDIYYIILFILFIFSFLEQFTNISQSAKKVIVFVFSLVYIFLSTFYEGDMGDYDSYKLFFQSVRIEYLYDPLNSWFEFLYTAVNYAVRLITSDYIVLRFVLSVIVMSLWYQIYTYSESETIGKNSLTFMMLLWALGYGNIYITRSTVSIAICLFSLRYVEKRDIKRFLLCTAIATGFHTMSVVWLLVYPGFHWLKVKYTLCISMICFAGVLIFSDRFKIIFSLLGNVFGNRIQRSIDMYVSSGTGQMLGYAYDMRFTIIKGMANIFLMIIVFQCLSSRYARMSDGGFRYFNQYFNLYLIGTIMYVISMPVSIGLSRVAVPFTYISFFLLPHMFDLPEIKRNQAAKVIVFIGFFAYIFLRFYLNLGNGTEGYKTVFA